jgi:hypothetical protein
MAIAVVMTFEGATLDQYDEVDAKMGFEPRGAGPAGLLFHWVASSDDGIVICDLWESKELFERFAQEKIGPYSAEVGVPSPPAIAYYEVHNYLTAGVPVAA